MTSETLDLGPYEITRSNVREYRKTATVRAGQAVRGGIIPTLEGDHSFEAGDYIAGPGAAGEFWPVKRAIFEATYDDAVTTVGEAGLREALAYTAWMVWGTKKGFERPDGPPMTVAEIRAALATPAPPRIEVGPTCHAQGECDDDWCEAHGREPRIDVERLATQLAWACDEMDRWTGGNYSVREVERFVGLVRSAIAKAYEEDGG